MVRVVRFGGNMRRREFITVICGAAVGLPLATRAQQPRKAQIGFLRASPAPEATMIALRRGLQMAGLNPTEITEMVPLIRAIRDSGVTLFLTEHVMPAVMSLADRVYVLNDGHVIAEGTPAEIVADSRVVEAYLGHGAAARLGRHQMPGGAHA